MKPALAWMGAIFTVIAAVAIFYQTWSYPFVLDDISKIQNNPDLRAPSLSLESWVNSYSEVKDHARNDPSRPLTFLLYWVCWQIGGGASEPFHILNTIIHALCAVMVGFLVVGIAKDHLFLRSENLTFFSAAFLFLLLPLNAGTVIYTYGLSDLLSALFALMILVSISWSQPISGSHYFIISLLFVLALATKQSSVVIPAMVLAVNPKQWRSGILLSVWALIYVLIRFIQFGRIGDLEAHKVYPVWDYLSTQGVLYFKYVRLALWPDHLTLDHAIFPRFYPMWLRVLSWSAWVALTGMSCWAVARSANKLLRWIGTGWLIFVLSLLPTSSFFPTTDLFVERRAYLGVSGLVLLFLVFISWIEKQKSNLGKFLLAVTLIASGILTWKRSDVFSEKEKVWKEVLEVYPGDTRARMNLSTAFLEQGRWQEARDLLEQLVKEEPRNFQAWSNLGTVYHSDMSPFHNLDMALKSYQTALEIEPEHINSLSNAGFLFLMAQKPDEAMTMFKKALAYSPHSPQYHYGLGQAAMMKGNQKEAIGYFQQALNYDPGFTKAKEVLDHLTRK